MPALTEAPTPRAWPMYRAMVGTGVVCGLAIVTVFELTRPVISRRQTAALERAVFDVLPAASSRISFALTASGRFQRTERDEASDGIVHAGYDQTGRLVGIAVEAQGMGYQDQIRLLYGYAPAQEAIVGLEVLETRETPGLGDRITRDAAFLENFVQLDVSLTADMSRPVHPIAYVPPGRKTKPWEIDGISGATVTSTAVARMLRESSVFWIPRIRANLSDFGRGG